MSTQINTIIFDLGNVLVDVDYPNFCKVMNWDYDKFMKFILSDFFLDFERGKHSVQEFFKELSCYIPLTKEDQERYKNNLTKKFPLRPRTWARLHYLKKKYRVILFSNTNVLDYEALDKEFELKRVIRNSYVSYAQGYIKPEPEAYKRVEELFKIVPKNTLFVDDKPENIQGARHAGWHAEITENEQRLFEVLKEYEIT